MERKEYSGWSNYETWNYALWLNNDQGSQDYWTERSREALSDEGGDRDDAAGVVADLMEAEADEMAEALGATGFLGDILTAAVREINFREVAEAFVSEVADDEGEE